MELEIYNEILSKSEHLSADEVAQYVGKELMDRVPVFDESDRNLQQAYEDFLKILALLKKPNAVISPSRVYGNGNSENTPEFKKLATLNQKYADGELMPDNSINIQCAAVYGKSFRDYEVERIQNSDLPPEIKMLSLRNDELLEKVNQLIEKKWNEFSTNFTNDFKKGLQRIIKNPDDNPVSQFRTDIKDTIKAIQNHKALMASQKS